MDHVRCDVARLQPPRQPKPVPSRLKGEGNLSNRLARLDRLQPPALQQPQQRDRVRLLLLHGLALNSWNHPSDEPTGLAQLNDHRQGSILIKGSEGTA